MEIYSMSTHTGQNIDHRNTADDNAFKAVLFYLDEQKFAVPADCVIEIVRAVSITKVPEAPEIVEGIFNYRGKIIPLLDIRKRFNLPERSLSHTDYFIVAKTPYFISALRVDNTSDCIEIQWSPLDNEMLKNARYFSGAAKLSSGLVLIHDLALFLSSDEAGAINLVLDNPTTGA